MPRALCVGNGNLQVNIDNEMNIRDLFFPLVDWKIMSVVTSAGLEFGSMEDFPG